MNNIKEVNLNCPKCDSKNIAGIERMGGIAGYNDIYTCLDCKIRYAVMYMSDKPVYKKIIE